MSNSYFRFKQFTVHQDRCAMKVGTDGVLLGAWVDVQDATQILDIGTGTGLIALMLAQRTDASITALEIDEKAAQQAQENVNNSPWKNQIQVLTDSFQTYAFSEESTFDLIVSNPPYFHNSLKAPVAERSKARHTDSLLPEELIEGSLHLLSTNGRLCVILPIEEGNSFLQKASENGLSCTKQTTVIPKIGGHPKRVLLQLERQKKACLENTLTIETETRHCYTEEFKKLTEKYYL